MDRRGAGRLLCGLFDESPEPQRPIKPRVAYAVDVDTIRALAQDAHEAAGDDASRARQFFAMLIGHIEARTSTAEAEEIALALGFQHLVSPQS